MLSRLSEAPALAGTRVVPREKFSRPCLGTGVLFLWRSYAIQRSTCQGRFPGPGARAAEFWKENHAFQKLRELHKDDPHWSFIDGPITANNPMGVHHGWGRTYKDLFQRFRAMRGRELRYQNGFDCQGLWVEVEVEKEMGFTIQEGHRGLWPGAVRAQVQGARAALRRRANRAIHPPGLLDGLERPGPAALAGRPAHGRPAQEVITVEGPKGR